MTDSSTQFLGTWKLVNWHCTADNGKQWYPYGEDASGYIIYTPQGIVSATLMKQERGAIDLTRREIGLLRKSLEDMNGDINGADEETLSRIEKYAVASTGYTAYCGSFHVSGSTVTHHIENSLYPDWIGTDLVRHFEFFDNRLLLTARVGQLTDKLLWERG
ncbi:hypothetical protein R50073_18300 [Maricurvus nonylphenolicus]|uniref:lipocalin-like domain-containing protein n=1 Tax=Maricurvus nonylphenolicus TaxID=1008307 RepID=UPI0036F1C99B